MHTILPRSPDLQHISKTAPNSCSMSIGRGTVLLVIAFAITMPDLTGAALSEILAADFSLQDAQLVVALNSGT